MKNLELRYIVIIVAILIILLPAVKAEDTVMERCTAIAGLAETMMTRRQENYDVVSLYEVAERQSSAVRQDLRTMIKHAYSMPLYSSVKYKNRSIQKFKNIYFLACYKEPQ